SRRCSAAWWTEVPGVAAPCGRAHADAVRPHDFRHADDFPHASALVPRRDPASTPLPAGSNMRQILLATACLFALSVAAARADDGAVQSPQLSSHQCGLSTPYNVQVDGGGVWLYRHDGVPKEIFFHDGTLSVDRQVQAVSDADARRLRMMED